MSRILSATRGLKKRAVSNCHVLYIKKHPMREAERIFRKKGSAKIGFMSAILILVAVVVVSGAFYLYQVNDLATKGYEMREVENGIRELKKINERNRIREVELKSMYNLEKTTQDLNMVNSDEISYLEINGPVAMK